jgi:hypothetical protein
MSNLYLFSGDIVKSIANVQGMNQKAEHPTHGPPPSEKDGLKPASSPEPSHERYTELVDPTTLGPGEGAKLVLSVGGLEEELKILDGLAKVMEKAEVEGEVGGVDQDEARREIV